MRSLVKTSLLLLTLLVFSSACQMINLPAMIGLQSQETSEDEALPNAPQYIHRDLIISGTSDLHRDIGYVRVTLDIQRDSFRLVSIESFDPIGQSKNEFYDYAPHQRALALSSRLKSLGPSRIAELDAVSGATVTVNAIKQAAIRAEQKARYQRSDNGGDYDDGTFLGVSDKTMRGWTTAIVTFSNDRITHVTLQGVSLLTETLSDGTVVEITDAEGQPIYVANGADYPWKEYHSAIEELERRYVQANVDGVETVDVISRATTTSSEAKIAVERAIQAAKK